MVGAGLQELGSETAAVGKKAAVGPHPGSQMGLYSIGSLGAKRAPKSLLGAPTSHSRGRGTRNPLNSPRPPEDMAPYTNFRFVTQSSALAVLVKSERSRCSSI